MQLAATDDVREIIPRCEKHPDLQMLGNMVWVIANTGLPNREFASLRKLDIDPVHVLLASPMRVLPIRSRTYARLHNSEA